MSGGAGLAEVTVRVDRSVPICAVRGEIDASNVGTVLERIIASAPNESPGLVLDLSETVYLDSAGVRILFELSRRLRTRRQELRVAVPQTGIVRRVLVLTALADIVPLHDDADSAAAAVRRRL
jgi:stage II sporulation protein AA (anti-sigma F factor antagonist)